MSESSAEKLARLERELAGSLAREAATAAILRVIQESASDAQPAFEAILHACTGLIEHRGISIWLVDGGMLRLRARIKLRPDQPMVDDVPLDRESVLGTTVLESRLMHIPDLEVTRAAFPRGRTLGGREQGHRSTVMAPLLRDGRAIGVLAVYRGSANAFGDAEIRLIQTFADQAVIAIENARLFRETKAALARQTATNDVLRVMTEAIDDVQPVFQQIVRSCGDLFPGNGVGLWLSGDGKLRCAARNGKNDVDPSAAPDEVPLDRDSVVGATVLDSRLIHLADMESAAALFPLLARAALPRGRRSCLAAPLLRSGVAVGAIMVTRNTKGGYSEGEIALLQTFADQAVIAIGNVRLFREIQDKNRLLQQQADELAQWNRTLEARVADGIQQLERAGRLKRFLPPQIAELVVSSGAETLLRHHRREIVVVFLDLRGFTAFTETADPEEVMSVLNEYHASMGRLIQAHGGTLDGYAGDGIMIFFNDPIEIPEPAQRAAAMALQMQREFAPLAKSWKQRGYDLQLGIGIAQGYATLGTIGFEGRWDYGAIGTVCNLAARLCGEARGGEILISPRVAAALGGKIPSEVAGELVLKGFARPVAASRLLESGPSA